MKYIIIGIVVVIVVLFFIVGSAQGSYQEVSASELDDFMKENPNYQYIDVRESYEYSGGHVKGFKNIASGNILNGNFNLSKDKKVVVICRSGSRSKKVATYLDKEGYEVINVKDGIMNYKGELV